jgi:hypothetical protein
VKEDDYEPQNNPFANCFNSGLPFVGMQPRFHPSDRRPERDSSTTDIIPSTDINPYAPAAI